MLKPFFCGLLSLSFLSVAIASPSQAQSAAQTLTQTASVGTVPALELQQFVQVLKRWKSIDLESQRKMLGVIKAEKMAPERFMEILKQLQEPNASTSEISADDKAKFEKIMAKFQEIEQEAIPKKEKAITAQGLEVQRFAQIQRIIQQDPTLQQRVQQMLGESPAAAAPTP
ncbi:MAG: DUF4168 domain-containing protein [Snowella sp.]|nr:DUF4168 domain-containing protein [Snowella sp.]